MIPQNKRDHCSLEQFIDKCKSVFQVGDSLHMETTDNYGECVIFRNSAKCMLAMWIQETEEYREF